ncbi:MAG TPA: lysylphosphatidylglycerol synthase domain-containing protein [Terriglobales bacterium]|nr:lysylphosphatidylglycerol synthase domain-containing protein [Terriglobales bacterium]
MTRAGTAALLGGLAGFVLVAYYFGDQVLATFARAQPWYLALYLAAAVAVRLGYVLRWRALARALRTDGSVRRLALARLAADAVAAISPAGRLSGDPLRIVLVREPRRGARAAAAVALDRLIETFGNSFAAMAYIAVFWITWSADRQVWNGLGLAMLAGGVGLAASLALLALGYRPLAPLYRLIDWLGVRWLRIAVVGVRRAERHAGDLMRLQPGLAMAAIFVSLAIEAVTVLEYSLIFRAFGVSLELPMVLVSMLVGGVSRAAPTPGGLGAFEASQVAAFGAALGQPELGFTVGIITRIHELLWAGVGFAALLAAGLPVGRLRSQLAAGKAATA